jgi:hypothetical protein
MLPYQKKLFRKKVQDQKITIKYQDRRRDNVETTLTIDGTEFLRRFMLHTLPKGFHRIRHYGFLSHRFKNENIEAIYRSLKKERPLIQELSEITAAQFFQKKFNIDITRCPQCKKGTLCAESRPPP